jgi:O-antigen ligase
VSVSTIPARGIALPLAILPLLAFQLAISDLIAIYSLAAFIALDFIQRRLRLSQIRRFPRLLRRLILCDLLYLPLLLLPLLGAPVVGLLSLFWFTVRTKGLRASVHQCTFLGVLYAWLAYSLYNSLSMQLVSTVAALNYLEAHAVLLSGLLPFREALSVAVGLALFLLGRPLFMLRPSLRRRAVTSLMYSVLLSAGVLLVDYLFLATPLMHSAKSEYWLALSRISGTLSDPNALGIVSALVIFLALAASWQANFTLRFAAIAVCIFLGLLSGSRTFVLGMALLLAFLLARRIPLRWLSLFIFSAAVCFQLLPGGWIESLSRYLPEALARVVLSAHHEFMLEQLFSRNAFWSVAFAVISDYPWIGVGPAGFASSFVSYAHALSLNTGVWFDNANSQYLSILAELGLIGTVLILVAFILPAGRNLGPTLASLSRLLIASRPQESRAGMSASMLEASQISASATERHWLRAATFVFCILLIFGPHLFFVEVAVVAALLVNGTPTLRRNKLSASSLPSALALPVTFLVFFGLIFISRPGFGLYHWESQEERYFRWSSVRARFPVLCTPLGLAPVTFRAHRSLELRYTVTFSAQSLIRRSSTSDSPETTTSLGRVTQHHLSVNLASSERHQPTLQCPAGVESAWIDLVVSPAFIPALAGPSDDFRVLGVQIEGEPSLMRISR